MYARKQTLLLCVLCGSNSHRLFLNCALHMVSSLSSSRFPFVTLLPFQVPNGWPLLTVETQVNGDSKNTNVRSPPWLVCWTGTVDFCPVLAALVGPVQNIFPHCTPLFQFLNVPIAQQASQTAVLGHLSLVRLFREYSHCINL